MIAMLRGNLLKKGFETSIVDVGGVGYQVAIPLTSLDLLPPEGSEVTLHIHTSVREDAIELFGFVSELDKMVYTKLIAVSGVGPKMALSILSTMKAVDAVDAIVRADVGMLTRVKGVGKRTAERLVLELRDPLAKLSHSAAAFGDLPSAPRPAGELEDLRSVLTNLGYGAADVDKLAELLRAKVGKVKFEDLVKEALILVARTS
jgi:Holliday junction DNA helicase RuvA